jgi:hypothetical protein
MRHGTVQLGGRRGAHQRLRRSTWRGRWRGRRHAARCDGRHRGRRKWRDGRRRVRHRRQRRRRSTHSRTLRQATVTGLVIAQTLFVVASGAPMGGRAQHGGQCGRHSRIGRRVARRWHDRHSTPSGKATTATKHVRPSSAHQKAEATSISNTAVARKRLTRPFVRRRESRRGGAELERESCRPIDRPAGTRWSKLTRTATTASAPSQVGKRPISDCSGCRDPARWDEAATRAACGSCSSREDRRTSPHTRGRLRVHKCCSLRMKCPHRARR